MGDIFLFHGPTIPESAVLSKYNAMPTTEGNPPHHRCTQLTRQVEASKFIRGTKQDRTISLENHQIVGMAVIVALLTLKDSITKI